MIEGKVHEYDVEEAVGCIFLHGSPIEPHVGAWELRADLPEKQGRTGLAPRGLRFQAHDFSRPRAGGVEAIYTAPPSDVEHSFVLKIDTGEKVLESRARVRFAPDKTEPRDDR